MLKSTHQATTPVTSVPLPSGWTEHKAPSGHAYYYNESTGKSTYKRPGADDLGIAALPPPPSLPPGAITPAAPPGSFFPYQALPKLSDPNVANAFVAQHHARIKAQDAAAAQQPQKKPPPQPRDRPISSVAIPGCEPWMLVTTKYGRRFAHNPEKKQKKENSSFWRIPERLKAGIMELDQARLRSKARGPDVQKINHDKGAGNVRGGDGGSDYEEAEVTDNEEQGDENDGANDDDSSSRPPTKRQRTAKGRDQAEVPGAEEEFDEPDLNDPHEFSEADIAFQLQAMNAEIGLNDGDYEDGNQEAWQEDAEDLAPISDEVARQLFRDLLEDMGPNPYAPWDRLVEEGRLVDDSRYTVLDTMRERKEVWDEWSAQKIKQVQERRAREEKKDPRIGFSAFLGEKASTKLYWAEFRRKYRKEDAMRDEKLAEKEKEKMYRDYVARAKLPLAQRKADLTALLKSLAPGKLHGGTGTVTLPAEVLADVRYVVLDPAVRDRMVDAYAAILPPLAEHAASDGREEDEQGRQDLEAREAREQRSKALDKRKKRDAEASQETKGGG